VGGQWGISYRLIRGYLKNPSRLWSGDISGYGIDSWMATAAITSGARICEANLGTKIHRPSAAKREMVFRQVVNVLFDRIVADKEWWGNTEIVHKLPFRKFLPTFGIRKPHRPEPISLSIEKATARYRHGFNRFDLLYEKIFPVEIYQQLKRLAEIEATGFAFPHDMWVQIVYHLLLAHSFDNEFNKGDLMDSLIPLFNGFMAGFATDMGHMETNLEHLPSEERDRLLVLEAEHKFEDLAEGFLRQRNFFLASWEISTEALRPPVPQVTYREFIPGVPLVVPTELRAPDGTLVRANDIYNRIFTRQKKDFEHFIYEKLKVAREASSFEISMAIKEFLHSVEGKVLPLGDMTTVEGTRSAVDSIFRNFPHGNAFSMIPEMASRLLGQHPPMNLITKWSYDNLDALLQDHDPLDVLALASWSEERDYVRGLWELMAEYLRSEHFFPCLPKPLVVSHEDFPALVEMRDSSALDKLTSRIVVSNLHKGMGGEFPKLRYLTTIAKNIIEAERFGQVWQRYADERKDFGRKVMDSISGHWGKDPLSAHNIFEDGHQRVLVDRVRLMAERIAMEEESGGDETRVARAESIRDIAESYHLALTMPDGNFVTCSAWSWASYSFKGGRSFPSPLSLHVERDWASREFLVEYYKAIGGTEAEVDERIIELMERGMESENLAPILLGTEKDAEKIVPEELVSVAMEQPLAGRLKRFEFNPILEPIKEHSWESRYVLNSGAIWLDGKVYLVYRAFGEDEVSRLGLAMSEDGLNFTERLDSPIFEPHSETEKRGCEDPRLTLIDDRIYMVYTAYDGLIAQIALASIGVKAFLKHQWGGWRRHGMVFPGFDDKDAALFPEQFDGKYAMLHRVDPHMWITFSRHLRCPWPRREHKILTGTTTGMMWDARKIGAGAQPLKTKYGWLLITHGVDYAHVYRLGVMLLDLANPSRLVYRSPNFILEPEEADEIGNAAGFWVPNVVFTCGALPRENSNKILEVDDELMIYYGAADTVMSAAIVRVGDLIPDEFH
ncbi:MAG: glycosidase, partial [Chloroflexota bacterium]|nr:glycosidase [Chloroflexota bacterium]